MVLITPKQKNVLDNFERIAVEEGETATGRKTIKYMLDGVNCREQVHSLAARGYLKRSQGGRFVKVAAKQTIRTEHDNFSSR